MCVGLQVGGEPGGVAMVQKYQSPVRVYKQPFELVMAVSGSSLHRLCVCFLSSAVLFSFPSTAVAWSDRNVLYSSAPSSCVCSLIHCFSRSSVVFHEQLDDISSSWWLARR